MAKLDDLVKELRAEFGGDMIQCSICGPDGMSIARETTLTDLANADMLTGRAVMAAETGKRAVGKLKLGNFEEIILTTTKAFIFSKAIGDGSYTILCSFTNKATLGTMRMLIEEYADRIWDAIPR
jgi:predicted regulator of Ras-like GTPase activity (Roadblock/LC7/MglB family)